MFEAIIFDMDGVIADSEPLHIKAERRTLAPYNLHISDDEFYQYMGKTPKMLLEGIIKKYDLDADIKELYCRHCKNLLKLYRTEVQPVTGAIELIHQLKNHGVKLGLASSSDFELIDTVLDRFRIRDAFSAVCSGQEMKRIKPWPDIFLKTAEKMDVKPESCAVIEDSTAGIQAAKSANMFCVGFRSPNSHNQNYESADKIVDSLTELDLKVFEMLGNTHLSV